MDCGLTKEQWKEGLIFTGLFLGAIWLVGKIVDGQRDTDKDWNEYVESKRRSVFSQDNT